MNWSFLIKLMRNFHQVLTSRTLSKLYHVTSLRGVSKDMQVPDITRDEFMRNFHLDDPTSETHQDSNCPPSNFLESWRSWRFLINLEVVSDDRDHPSEASVKVSSRSIIRNTVKNPPVLQVSPWSLGGRGGS